MLTALMVVEADAHETVDQEKATTKDEKPENAFTCL